MREIKLVAQGPMGEGKSTLLNLVASLLESSGVVVSRDKSVPIQQVTAKDLTETVKVTLSEEVSNTGIPGKQVGSIGGLETPK